MIVSAVALPTVVLAREALHSRSLSGCWTAPGRPSQTACSSRPSERPSWLPSPRCGYARELAAAARPLSDILFVVIFAVPSTIVSVGLIGCGIDLASPVIVYGTDAMFILACWPAFFRSPRSSSQPLSSACRSLVGSGGRCRRRLARMVRRILLPQLRLGVAATWVVVFVLSFGELGGQHSDRAARQATLPIRVYTLIANAPPAQVAALALLQATVVLTPVGMLRVARIAPTVGGTLTASALQ